jgi:CheY-like chemotaxis protein
VRREAVRSHRAAFPADSCAAGVTFYYSKCTEYLWEAEMNAPDERVAVLLVEDGESCDGRLGKLLAHWGWPVDCLAGGEAAFARLCRADYGCVISDHRMVRGDGLMLAQRWLSIRDPATPLLISATEIDALAIDAYAALGVPVLAQDGASCAALRLWIAQALALRSWADPQPPRIRCPARRAPVSRWLPRIGEPWRRMLRAAGR